ncbi:MAG: NapC/NirT family cytochrome c [Anaerolineae bacterium]|nr:NapC/NirT family cytochrome c [Anaerolineae bacterium]
MRLLLIVVGVGGFLFVFFIGVYELVHVTESTGFCISCHDVMNPEATTHQTSPHAHTDCGTCHIGPGIINKFANKLRSVRYLWYYPLELYERPLASPPTTLRPAQVVCEQCHWPKIFYPVRITTIYDYAQDETNSLTQVVLPLRVGSGEQMPEDYGPGIHWHIQNPVYYIATDYARQDIPWVQAEIDGEVKEYLAVDAGLTQEEIDQAEKRRMDCMDCHNRATHVVPNPSDVLNDAMASGMVPSDLPYIKDQGMKLFGDQYDTAEEAAAAIEGLVDFYRDEYPGVYAGREADINTAVEGLKTVYSQTHFPYMEVYWDTYPNNIGHGDFPGCYRCHDGKHLDEDNQAIRLQCNLCHYVPQVAEPGQPLPAVSLEVPVLPESHKDTLWMAKHPYLYGESCTECHTINNPGGSDNSGFCSNSMCHGRDWKFVDFDVAAIQALVVPTPAPAPEGIPSIPHPPVGDCLRCHGPDQIVPFPENHADYTSDMCTGCHQSPESEPPAASPGETGSPPVPHELEDREDCLLCHDPGGKVVPAPASHADYTNDICLTCHRASGEDEGEGEDD